MVIKWSYNFLIWYPYYGYERLVQLLKVGGIVDTEISSRISSTITYTLEDNLN